MDTENEAAAGACAALPGETSAAAATAAHAMISGDLFAVMASFSDRRVSDRLRAGSRSRPLTRSGGLDLAFQAHIGGRGADDHFEDARLDDPCLAFFIPEGKAVRWNAEADRAALAGAEADAFERHQLFLRPLDAGVHVPDVELYHLVAAAAAAVPDVGR